MSSFATQSATESSLACLAYSSVLVPTLLPKAPLVFALQAVVIPGRSHSQDTSLLEAATNFDLQAAVAAAADNSASMSMGCIAAVSRKHHTPGNFHSKAAAHSRSNHN